MMTQSRIRRMFCLVVGCGLATGSYVFGDDDLLGNPFPDDGPAETSPGNIAEYPGSEDSNRQGDEDFFEDPFAADDGTVGAFNLNETDSGGRVEDLPEIPDNVLAEEGLSNQDIQLEVIRERYQNRSLKIERHVTQDAKRNYVNHGSWLMWDLDGTLLGKGEYRFGQRQGKWIRIFRGAAIAGDVTGSSDKTEGTKTVFSGKAYRDFHKPFISGAIFDNGNLTGAWRVVDAKGRKIIAWEFNRDELDGKSTWWYPDGTKRREIDVKDGVLDGEWIEWDTDQNVAKRESYSEGRKSEYYVERYPSGQKYCEGMYLFAEENTNISHDWWNGIVKFDVAAGEGEDQKYGRWVFWHQNGQKISEGDFIKGKPVGRHHWWYENGQKKAEGEFQEGLQHSNWLWWHENGQKQMQGHFATGRQAGIWTIWAENGQVQDSTEYPMAMNMAENADVQEPSHGLRNVPNQTIRRHGPAPQSSRGRSGKRRRISFGSRLLRLLR